MFVRSALESGADGSGSADTQAAGDTSLCGMAPPDLGAPPPLSSAERTLPQDEAAVLWSSGGDDPPLAPLAPLSVVCRALVAQAAALGSKDDKTAVIVRARPMAPSAEAEASVGRKRERSSDA